MATQQKIYRSKPPCATVPQLRKWFVDRIQSQQEGATVEWIMPLKRVTFPTGMRGIVGQARVSADGFRTKNFMVTADPYGKSAH